jgi:hypothetical protein
MKFDGKKSVSFVVPSNYHDTKKINLIGKLLIMCLCHENRENCWNDEKYFENACGKFNMIILWLTLL